MNVKNDDRMMALSIFLILTGLALMVFIVFQLSL